MILTRYALHHTRVGTYPFAYPIPCPGGYEGMGYGTSEHAHAHDSRTHDSRSAIGKRPTSQGYE